MIAADVVDGSGGEGAAAVASEAFFKEDEVKGMLVVVAVDPDAADAVEAVCANRGAVANVPVPDIFLPHHCCPQPFIGTSPLVFIACLTSVVCREVLSEGLPKRTALCEIVQASIPFSLSLYGL